MEQPATEVAVAAADSSAAAAQARASYRRKDSVSMDDAIQQVGTGAAQWELLIICGLTFCSDAAEVTFLSYVTEVLRCEWGMTPRQESFITSAVFGGMIVGAPVWGWSADKIGRRPIFLISSAVICSFGFLTAACQGFIQLLVCRAIVGFGVSGLPVGFDILAEALPGDRRGKFLLYIEFFWTLGSIYVNVCAWGVLERAGWRIFTAMAAIPTLIASIAGLLALPESPRWLITQGKEQSARAIVNKWAKQNGRKHLEFEIIRSENPEVAAKQHSITDLITKRKLRKPFLLMSIVWLAFGIAYYGIVMLLPRIFEKEGAEGEGCSIAFDFKDLAISSAAEVLGVIIAILIIENPGRATCQGIFYTTGAVSAVLLGFRSLGKVFLTVVASVGRLSEMAASCATWVHTPELFPTQVRAEAHSILNLISKIGAAIAPFLISDMFTQFECAAIMGGMSLLAGISACCLPETAGVDMSEISDVGSTDEGETGSEDNTSSGQGE